MVGPGRPAAGPLPHAGATASSVLVKAVGAACNMHCRYCFYDPRRRGVVDHGGVMDAVTLELLVRQVLRLPAPAPAVCWQGGEPTLAGLAFYERALALQHELAPGRRVRHSLQTNGLLLDSAWARFLSREGFLAGLSLDGPKDVHDAMRGDRRGRSTWRATLDAAHRLQDAGVPVNALCCLTRHSVGRAEELYHFFRSEGFEHVQFLPVLETDMKDPLRLAPWSLEAEDYGELLCGLWDMWLADLLTGKAPGIRYFESFCHVAFGHAPTLCEMEPVCASYAVIERDGSVFPCDFFVSGNWRLGHLGEGLPEVLRSPLARHFGEIRLMQQPACRACPWRGWCHGGYLKYRRAAGRLHGQTLYCAAYRRFFAHASPSLARVAVRLQLGPRPSEQALCDCPA